MSDYFTSRLAPIASLRVQERFGRNATTSEYLVPSELLQWACECVEKLEERDPPAVSLNAEAQAFNAEAKAALGKLTNLLRSKQSELLEELPWSLLLENQTWLAISQHARTALAALGFDITAWEDNEVGGHNVP